MPSWKKVLISGSDAALNTLNVTTALTASGLIYPTVDGSPGQSIVTDGNGNLSFTTISGGGDTGSLLSTASAAGSTITFEKGDGSTFDVTISSEVTPANALVTASLAGSTLTFEKGDSSTFDIILPSGGGGYSGESATAHHTQSIAAETWSFAHNLGDRLPVVTVYDSTYDIIIPNEINAVDSNNLSIVFSTPRTGYATAVIVGASSSFASTASYVQSINVDGPLGMDSITSASYALTASYGENFVISGSIDLNGYTWPTQDGIYGVEVLTTDGAGNLTFEIPTNVYETVKNVSGEPLLKGTPVHATGSNTSGNLVGVIPADALDPTRMPATYVLASNLADGEEGLGIAVGFINGVDTTGLVEGEPVYVKAGGGWTQTKPTGSALIQNLGIVTKVAENGSGVVLGAGRSNDVPNIQEGYSWVGNSDQVATAIPTASFFVTSGSHALNADDAISASYALTASYAANADLLDGHDSSVFATTGSNIFTGNQTLTGSSIYFPDDQTGIYLGDSGSFTSVMGFPFIESNVGYFQADARTYNEDDYVSLILNSTNDQSIFNVSDSTFGRVGASITLSSSGSFNIATHTNTATLLINGVSYDAHLATTGSNTFTDSQTITGDLTVTGTITAQEFHTEFVSASIIYQSGSTQFGNSADDTHIFTGSVNIDGAVTANSFTGSFTGSFYGDGSNLSGVTSYTDEDTLSFIQGYSGSYSGSFIGDGSQLSGVTSYTDADTLSYINSLQVLSGSIQNLSGSFTGSFFGDGAGLTNLGYGDTKKLSQTVAATTWSFSHNMNEQYPAVTVYNTNNEVIQPSRIEAVDAQQLNLYFGSPTAGTAVAVVGGVATTQEAGFNRVFSQGVAATTWSFEHNLGNKYPQVAIYDSNDELIIPGKLEAIDQNNLTVYFDTPQAGTISATIGGTSLTASYANTLVVVDTLLSTQENTDVDTGIETVATVSVTNYDGAFFDYIVKDGTNFRAGTVMAVWDGSSVQYNDNSTTDIGDTSGVTLSVDISGTDARLRATVSSDNWNIKAFVRAL